MAEIKVESVDGDKKLTFGIPEDVLERRQHVIRGTRHDAVESIVHDYVHLLASKGEYVFDVPFTWQEIKK